MLVAPLELKLTGYAHRKAPPAFSIPPVQPVSSFRHPTAAITSCCTALPQVYGQI